LQCGGGRGDYFQIGSVFIKRSNQTGYLKKTKTKPEPVQTDRFRFSYFRTKISSNWLGCFSAWLGFSSLARVFFGFFVWVRFGLVFSVSGL
jgi:hypothetical protein